MKKDEIPKPPKQKRKFKDKRAEFLDEWKRLFQEIHPDIEITIYSDEDCYKIFREVTDYVDLGSSFRDVKIIVCLPEELELEYLIGITDNKMYSKIEVESDLIAVREHDLDTCEPETSTWDYFYNKVYQISNRKKKEISNPLIPDTDLVKIGTPLRLVDTKGRQACIGDRIRFSNTEGHVTEHNKFVWDEKNMCLCVGDIPFYKLMESGYIQSVTPGSGNFDFEIV